MPHDPVLELLRRKSSPELHRAVRELWQEHSKAEDRRDIPGLLATLTDDCVYELFPGGKRWTGHAGAERFYTELLHAFPDVKFQLTDIVIGPQGVCEEAAVTATHLGDWLDHAASGRSVQFKVVIFFPWDLERAKFRGEKIYLDGDSFAARAPGAGDGNRR
jgi:predicted ester cyclase